MATLKEVANRANVSTATVSYALNGNDNQVGKETREKVLEIIRQLNYKPNKIAKSLRTNKTHTIGIIAEDITVLNTPDIINGIGDYAEEHSYNIILNNLRLYKRVGNKYSDIENCKKDIASLIETILSRGGVIDAARELGVKIPEDLSLVGFGNRECSFYYVPKLTTVEIPLTETGRVSAQFLVDSMNNNQPGNQNAKLKCKLIERESACIPKEL